MVIECSRAKLSLRMMKKSPDHEVLILLEKVSVQDSSNKKIKFSVKSGNGRT